MADKNQLKIADQVDLADDDPFAELTRIMGFDPRQPAKQAAPQPAAVEQAAEEDDFSLDLEKELLGSFDLEDETSEPGAPVEAAAASVETSASRPEAVAAEAPEVDFDFSADFDAAMAASTEDAAAGQDAEFDLGLTEDDVRALDVEDYQSAAPAEAEAEVDFDFGLTEDDVRALDAETFQPAAPVEAAPAVAGAEDRDIDADLDAAMADIDMDFLGDAAAPEPAAAAPADEAPEALQEEVADAGDVDLHLFDEDDFRLEDEPAPAVEPEPEQQPELDDSAFSFGEDELRLDDVSPAEEQSAQPAAEELSFDDVDFTTEDFSAPAEPETIEGAEPATVAEEPLAAAEPDFSAQAEPDLAPRFELPRYEPRKLPISPMDVAAEEFRQREIATAPAEPEFNLEDELNALLGNIRASQAAASTDAAPEPARASAPAYEPPAYEPPAFEPPADFHQPASPSTYETSGAYETSAYETSRQAADEPQDARASEPISFDPPEHPADIDDDLNWELDDVFGAEAEPEQVEDDQALDGQPEAYAEDDQPAAYAQDRQYDPYAEAAQPEDDYADEEPALLDFDDLAYDQPAEEAAQPASPGYYGDALAGAAIGAASRFDSGFAARPFETGASQRLSELPSAPARMPDRFAERPQVAAESDTFSPHRDPVVRGNPLKEDPLDIITALAAKYSKKEPITPYGRAMGVAAGTASFGEAAEDEDIDISAAFEEEQPEVETVEVADQAVALADDLDIPELAEEEELPPVSAYDDLDAEFTSLLGDMNAEPRAVQPANGYDDTLDGGFHAQPYQTEMVMPNAPRQAAQPARKAYDDDPEPDSFALNADELPGSRMPSGAQYAGAQFAADEYDYDPNLDQEIAAPHHLAAESRQQPKSRGMLLASLVGGVALVGAIGAFALSFGNGAGGDAPAIVRADDGPVKVKPENPGGSTVPNQDNKVYETVAGEDAADAPQQEKLVTTAEEPVDVTPPPPAMEEETAAAPSGKSEDRIEQILDEAENQTDAEIVAVSPRKVRTMVVKPDGTLVPREDEPGAAAPSGEQTETIAAAPGAGPAPAIPESTGALPAAPETAEAAPPPALAPAPEEAAAAAPPPAEEEAPPPAQEQIAAVEPASEDRGVMPETAPIAPLRPADQPIDVVGEVKPDQVAAVTATAPDGNWAMQIASQPSEAAAQSSYQDLARRYGGVLQGKEVNIVKAEIAGKGTFWRVRVPAGSRNEAISLCENYKAAGGNCFVSR